ncbi:hypothetical protein, partial [Faecalibacterium sp.]|uniref:hypothetical protein n=1 Tax=Faecalibacterium sp. TaxID=1971605 RepID=UPI003A954A9C
NQPSLRAWLVCFFTEGAVVASGIFSGCAVISEGNKRNRCTFWAITVKMQQQTACRLSAVALL